MAGGGAFCLPTLARWLWRPRLFPSGYGDVPSNLPAGEAGKRQGPGSSSPFLFPPPFIPSPPSAAGFAAPPSRPVSPNSIQSPLHPIKRSLSSFFFFFLLLAGFLGAETFVVAPRRAVPSPPPRTWGLDVTSGVPSLGAGGVWGGVGLSLALRALSQPGKAA